MNKHALPMKITMYVTNYCNYNCEYCFFSEKKLLNTEEMPIEMINRIVTCLKKNNVSLLSIAGGDPFLYDNIVTFLNLLQQNNIYPVIATNAIDKDIYFYQQLKDAGIKYIQIGLDSLSNNIKDNYKEDKHVSKVMKSVKIIKEMNLMFGFATCITKENYLNILEIAKFANFHGAELLKISFYDGENSKFKLTKEQKNIVINQIISFNNDNKKNFIKNPDIENTLNHISNYPSVTFYTNGDFAVENTGEVLGNIMTDEPDIEYYKYLERSELI